jgi:hypothetical protein
MLGPVCEVARSAAADSPCLGSGSGTKTQVHACIGRLSAVAGTARARWLWQLAAVCWAEVLRATTDEADRGLGPMLPPSACELWPFCVLRDSCHAALICVTQLCQISQVYRVLGRDAGLAALAATQTPSDLLLMATASMQRQRCWVISCGCAFCQLASQGFPRTFPRVELFCVHLRACR